MDLFRSAPVAQPLAARLRATTLDEYVGQEHLLARGKPLREALEQGALHSMIFWGPPGVGKTTLARLLAQVTDAHFETISAVLSGVKEIRQAVEVVFTAQEILVGYADYPTDKIADTTRAFRQLGLGYANLGALLMALGLPYDSDDGRAWAAAITALISAQSLSFLANGPRCSA